MKIKCIFYPRRIYKETKEKLISTEYHLIKVNVWKNSNYVITIGSEYLKNGSEKNRHNIGILILCIYNSWNGLNTIQAQIKEKTKIMSAKTKRSLTFLRHSFVLESDVHFFTLSSVLYQSKRPRIEFSSSAFCFVSAARLFYNKEIIGDALLTLISHLMGIC